MRTRSTLVGSQRTSGSGSSTRASSLHPALQRLGLQAADAALDHRMQRRLAVHRHDARVELGQLEQIVDQHRHRPHLPVDGRQVLLGRRQAVVHRLEHRLHRGQRRPQVVAGPGDQLAARVEQPLQARRHLVDRARQLVELGGPASRSTHVEPPADSPSAVARTGDRPRETDRANSSAPITAAVDDAAATPSTARSWSESNITAPERKTTTSGSSGISTANTTSCQRSVGIRRAPRAMRDAGNERTQRRDDRDVDHGTSL